MTAGRFRDRQPGVTAGILICGAKTVGAERDEIFRRSFEVRAARHQWHLIDDLYFVGLILQRAANQRKGQLREEHHLAAAPLDRFSCAENRIVDGNLPGIPLRPVQSRPLHNGLLRRQRLNRELSRVAVRGNTQRFILNRRLLIRSKCDGPEQ